nr:class I mannose-6-phosphate isomerase [Altererythrobacter sp. ZODW24]
MVEKVWGRETLPAPFAAPAGKRIGEIWFEPPAQLDALMVKYLFTSEKLSIQVHPDAALAQAAGAGTSGKDECWLVIDADEGATLGVGFREAISKERIREAALDGSIEQMVEWHPVERGDFFYIPAGTIHAIGAGVSLIEVQQNTDITYRLYDYGRPRELHLDRGIEAVRSEPYPAHLRQKLSGSGAAELVDGPFFRLDRIQGAPEKDIASRHPGAVLVLPLDQALSVAGATVRAGDCAIAVSIADIEIGAGGHALIASPCG